ncbi:MAG: type II toxin-antitoxin system VapC family toxin [Verrucomicrobiota bacterium]
MDANPNRRVLIAVDSNVPLDLAEEVEDVTDAMTVIRDRLPEDQMVMPPTVSHELADETRRGTNAKKRNRAMRTFQLARNWNIQPMDLVAVHHGIAERIGRRLREIGLLPDAEINVSLIVAEAALLGCFLLLSSDGHLREMDFERLTFEPGKSSWNRAIRETRENRTGWRRGPIHPAGERPG